MKAFESVTVYIEYRGDDGVPDDRLIRGRVVESVTARGGVCKAFGNELIAPRKITDRDMHSARITCMAQLRGIAKRIIFRYEPLLNLKTEEYPVNEVA